MSSTTMPDTTTHETAPAAPASSLSDWLSANLLMLLVFVLLAGGALTVRLLTYDRYLPFVDYTDEAVYIGYAQHFRGVSDETGLLETYGVLAPAYVGMNVVVQVIFDALKPYDYNLQADYYPVLRLIAVVMGTLTSLVIAWIGWQVGNRWAGLFAGAVWAFAPIIVEYNSLAIPDPPVYLLMAIAISTGITAMKTRSPRWLLISLLAGITVIYLKLWTAMAVVPFLMVTAYLLLTRPRRLTTGWLVVYGVIIAVSASVLIFGLDPLNNTVKISDQSGDQLITLAMDISRLTNNLEKALIPIGIDMFFITLLAGTIAWIISLRQGKQRAYLPGVMVLVMVVLVGMPLTAAISNVTADERIRHILPTAIALYCLWGIALGQIIWTVAAQLRRMKTPFSIGLAAAGVSAIVIVGLMPGYVQGNIRTIEKFQREHVVNALRDWSDVNLPPGGLVMFPGGRRSDLDRVWNRLWGAYRGNRQFIWWTELPETILETDPETYVERDIRYLTIDDKRLGQMPEEQEAAMRDYLDDLMLIKTFNVDPAVMAGSTTHLYRMYAPGQQTNIIYGETIVLSGYESSGDSLEAGETFTFRPYWTIEQVPQANYSLFIHLHTPDDPAPIIQHDGPLTTLDRPTVTWDDLDETYIGQEIINLAIPDDLEAGDYVLSIGVYDVLTGTRLAYPDGENAAYQMPITVR